ncbi:MAG: hypothetical protein F2950_03405, partial [Actinobacteria bacterium]|nr:hypothetical protein [Actinomycetota bacterium]
MNAPNPPTLRTLNSQPPPAVELLHLTDTRPRRVEKIEPSTPGRLSIYACGPTVYRFAHVGNLRTFLLSDLIRRVATLQGLQVTVVQNITDVGHMA